LGGCYSRSLDFWGVELQKAGRLAEAKQCFKEAVQLNPGNSAARINEVFNEKYLASGKEMIVAPAKELDEEKVVPRGGWLELLNSDGPLDEPNCRDKIASLFVVGGNYRQAVQELDRIREVSPKSLLVQLQLAQLMIDIQTYTNGSCLMLPYTEGYAEAVKNTDQVLKKRPGDPLALFIKSVALIHLKEYNQAIELLNQVLAVQTKEKNYLAQLNRAIAYFKAGNLEAARQDYQAVSLAWPHTFQVYYGLGEIAYQQKDAPSAVKNYQLYLANAPTNTDEARFVSARLAELKPNAH